ncbi:hypothetical protein L9F63_002108, partial [Diploptera punctata]
MPFIDDDLLWCPDNDGKMVDLSQCLCMKSGLRHKHKGNINRKEEVEGETSGLGELSQSDLTGLVSSLDEDDDEDLFKQLGELDNFFTDFEEKEENNNNVVSPGSGGGAASDVVTSSTAPVKNATSLQDARAKKFTIAAANPLLAETLRFCGLEPSFSQVYCPEKQEMGHGSKEEVLGSTSTESPISLLFPSLSLDSHNLQILFHAFKPSGKIKDRRIHSHRHDENRGTKISFCALTTNPYTSLPQKQFLHSFFECIRERDHNNSIGVDLSTAN